MTINQLRHATKDELIDLILDLQKRIFRIQEDEVLPICFINKIRKHGKEYTSHEISIPSHYIEYLKLKIDTPYRIYIKR